MNLQTLSLPNTEALARQGGETSDISSKVESSSKSMLNSVMKVPPLPPKKPPEEQRNEGKTPIERMQLGLQDIDASLGMQQQQTMQKGSQVLSAFGIQSNTTMNA